MLLNCEVKLATDVSKKTGNPYTYLEICFENGYKKRLFLDSAETYMLEQLVGKN